MPIVIGGAVAAAAGLGAWTRWSTSSVVLAYRAGRFMGRADRAQPVARNAAAPPLQVAGLRRSRHPHE